MARISNRNALAIAIMNADVDLPAEAVIEKIAAAFSAANLKASRAPVIYNRLVKAKLAPGVIVKVTKAKVSDSEAATSEVSAPEIAEAA